MKSSLASRRQVRKLGQDDDEQDENSASSSTVVRPPHVSRASSKTKKRSSLRTSFGPGGTSMNEEDDEATTSAVLTPKKSNLGRQAVEKNALRKSIAANLSADHLPQRRTEERPSYSSETLNELKISTPSTPKNLQSHPQTEIATNNTLDLAAKFGSDLSVYDTSTSLIPTDAEIREKKERRARLAKEQDFISLDDDDDNDNPPNTYPAGTQDSDADSTDERSLLPYAQEKALKDTETRLVRDDEDTAEGFDEFVSDGRIALGKRAEREQRKRQEVEIRNMINEAEGADNNSDDSTDESEAERHAAYEAAQTRKGLEGLNRDKRDEIRPRRPRTPPRISALPTLRGCVEGLRERVEGKRVVLGGKQARLEEVRKELADIETRKGEVQRLLKEVGERYEGLRREVGTTVEEGRGVGKGEEGVGVGEGVMVGIEGSVGMGLGSSSRGLEGWGDVG